MLYSINKDLCTKCDICVNVCPSKISIVTTENDYYIDEQYCIKCGHCGAVCPHNAVLCNEQLLPETNNSKVKPESLFNFITEKRSVRNYKNNEISEEDIKSIIQICKSTATASNNRSMKISVLKGKEVETASKTIADKMLKQINLMKNPVIKLIAGSKIPDRYKNHVFLNSFTKQMEDTISGIKDRIFFNAPAVIVLSYHKKNKMFGRTDCAIAGTSSMLYAQSLGLSSCAVGFAEYNSSKPEIKKALNIPENYKSGLVFTIGYGTEKYFRIPKR